LHGARDVSRSKGSGSHFAHFEMILLVGSRESAVDRREDVR